MSSTIELVNVGPIEHLSIPVPPQGGITVLLGRNGRGKTKALEAIRDETSGIERKISVRDGQAKAEIDVCGLTIEVGRSTIRSGELEVLTLRGKFSIGDFVDPKLKSPESADARRIKVLCAFSTEKPDPSLFWQLLGSREAFESIVGTHALASEDIVTMAARIKADIETAARKAESQADHAEGRSRGAREAASGIDTTLPDDCDELQRSLEVAIREEAALKQQATAASKARKARQEAQDLLEDAQASFSGQSADEAEDALEAAKDTANVAGQAVAAARLALAKAEAEYTAADLAVRTATKALTVARQHERTIAGWKEQLAKELPEQVSPERLAYATQQVQVARDAVQNGVLVRTAKQRLAEAAAAAKEVIQHRKQADEYREAAKGPDEVLTQIVAKVTNRLRVEGGRFILETTRGPSTFFHELSRGEKTKIACDIGIDAVGSPGLLVLEQELWEGLDPIAQREIAEHVYGRGVNFITAKATEDPEITAEVFSA